MHRNRPLLEQAPYGPVGGDWAILNLSSMPDFAALRHFNMANRARAPTVPFSGWGVPKPLPARYSPAMASLTATESATLERAADAPMLAQVERWAAVNSGTGNLSGLKIVAGQLADAFAVLPGDIRLVAPDPVESVDASGAIRTTQRGDHLHLRVRPEAPVQLLLTGHMDTVFAADHPFQTLKWREPGVLNGPGTADMKAGISVILAALTALEASPLASRVGYDVMINSDEETGSHASAALIAELAKGKTAAARPLLKEADTTCPRGYTERSGAHAALLLIDPPKKP